LIFPTVIIKGPGCADGQKHLLMSTLESPLFEEIFELRL